ncbi:MAG: AraC family transcriptional regulator, partial [Deinococcales bacterium]
SWGLGWHRNEGIELTYVSRGKTGFALDDRTFLLTRGDLTVTRPWQEHRVGDPEVGACRLYWLILDVGVRRPNQVWRWPRWLLMREQARERLSELLRHDEQPVWSATEAVGVAFERLGRLVEEPFDSTTDARLELRVNELLVELLRMLEMRDVALDRNLTSSRRSVEVFLDHLARQLDQPWTLERMAGECGLRRSQFAAYCRELTNASPHAYLRRTRLALARQLLRERRDLTVTDVAYACGFSSSQYFATAFRKDVGVPPSAYRIASG